MKYEPLAEVYEKLEKESSKLGKTSIIADFIRHLSGEELEMSVLLLQGRVFPTWSAREVGIASLLMIKIARRKPAAMNRPLVYTGTPFMCMRTGNICIMLPEKNQSGS